MAMKKGLLSDYFEAVAVKTLSAVDSEPVSSGQHEVGGKETIGKVLGPWDPRVRFSVTYLWIGDQQESIAATGEALWYNTREGKPRAPEPRLYYYANPVTEMMSAGDTLFLARRPDNTLFFIVVQPQSTIESQLLWLFGIDERPGLRFQVSEIKGEHDATMDFAARLILDELGIEYEDPEANTIEAIVRKFDTFPKTKEFSDLARLTLPKVNAQDDPDAALIAWLDHEERMFRQLEKRLLGERLINGFLDAKGEPDVDGFIAFSLSVQNRRKSRMGHSFEHHLGAVFDAFGLLYDKGAITEQGNKPDFLFPDKTRYDDRTFDASLLSMVGAKSTCKDRWRQVTFEANRIKIKHLVTLEPAVSEPQTDQMAKADVQLVLPLKLHATFTEAQRKWLWSVQQLVKMLSAKQDRGVKSVFGN
jgi:hypothetical protein